MTATAQSPSRLQSPHVAPGPFVCAGEIRPGGYVYLYHLPDDSAPGGFAPEAAYRLHVSGDMVALAVQLAPGAGQPGPAPECPAGSVCPNPAWAVGVCPACGGDLVTNSYYTGGHGYGLVTECWGSLSWPAVCSYRQAEGGTA